MSGFLRKTAILGFIVSLGVSSFSGCYFLPKEEKLLPPPLIEPEKPKYDTVKVERTDLRKELTGSAKFQYVRQIDLAFRPNGGLVHRIHVRANDKVKKGDVLVELDIGNIESQMNSAKTSLEKARINYEQTLLQAESSIRSAENQLKALKKQYEELLANPDLATKAQLEELQQKIADQEYVVKNTKQNYGPDGYNIRLAKLAVQEAETRYSDLQKQYTESRLVSPIDGEVVFVHPDMREGRSIGANITIVTVADTSAFHLVYDGDKVSKLKLGQKVELKPVGAWAPKDSVFEGTVVQIPPLPKFPGDNPPQIVYIDMPNIPDTVQLGDFANFTVVEEESKNTLVVPAAAVKRFGGRTFVYKLEDGLRKQVDVEVGLRTNMYEEILSGLNEGDEVFLR